MKLFCDVSRHLVKTFSKDIIREDMNFDVVNWIPDWVSAVCRIQFDSIVLEC